MNVGEITISLEALSLQYNQLQDMTLLENSNKELGVTSEDKIEAAKTAIMVRHRLPFSGTMERLLMPSNSTERWITKASPGDGKRLNP